MNSNTQIEAQDNKVKFSLKGFLTICFILLGVMIIVGILTYIIPAGAFDVEIVNGNSIIVPGTFKFIDDANPLPFYRWFTAPIEQLFNSNYNMKIIPIISLLLILGGTFNVLDDTGGLISIVRVVVNKFFNKRYLSIWIITLVMMLLSSLFGLQEELLVLFPLFLMFAKAMNWGKVQAISLILLTSGVGFTVAILNPFSIGVASELAGINIFSGVWYRIIIFVTLYIFTSIYLVYRAKKEEKLNANNTDTLKEFSVSSKEEKDEDLAKTKMISIMFLSVLAVLILSVAVPAISKLGIGMILMGVSFLVGTFIIGSIMLKSFKKMLISFEKGMLNISPSVVIILLGSSVKYIADSGYIFDTIAYYFSEFISSKSPYLAILIIFSAVLVFEFFIPGASAKAYILIPLLTFVPLAGISVNVILLAYLFGDGYANILYPTCGTLVIGLSLADITYGQWIKKTIVFQIILFVTSILFLFLAIAIGI